MADFFIPIPPKPAPRPRLARTGHAYHPPTYTAYKASLSDWIEANVTPVDYTKGHVSLNLEFVCAKPKTGKLEYPIGDLDNYAKGVMDAITDTELFWRDDSQVVRLTLSKNYGPTPGVFCRIDAS